MMEVAVSNLTRLKSRINLELLSVHVLLGVFFVSSILHNIREEKFFLLYFRVSQIAGLLIFILMFQHLFKKKQGWLLGESFSGISMLFVTIVCSMLIAKLATSHNYYYDLIYPITYIGVAIGLARMTSPLKIIWGVYIFIFLFILYKKATAPNPELWVAGSSNQVTAMLISTTILFYIERYRSRKSISIWPAIANLMFSIFATGTSGIIVATILLVGVLTYRYRANNVYRYFLLPVGFLGLIYTIWNMAIIFGTPWYFREFLLTFAALESGDEPRLYILKTYYDTTGLSELIFGNRVAIEELKQYQSLSSHNSYISWHAEWGAGSFIVLFLIFVSAWTMLKRHAILVFFMFLLGLRAATDNLLFTGGIYYTIPFVYIFALGDPSFQKKIYYDM